MVKTASPKNLGIPQVSQKDLEHAIRWYERAADQGEAMAMFNLGNLYHRKGYGVSQDESKARALCFEEQLIEGTDKPSRRWTGWMNEDSEDLGGISIFNPDF